MTAETLAAALLKGVPRNVALGADTPMLFEQHVLAALSRAMSDDLAERVGVIAADWEEQASERDPRDPTKDQIFREAADIRAILAQNAALRAERDAGLQREADANAAAFRHKARAERLEAALQWCSGSADFNEGGVAREGWLKLCAPLLKGEQP